MLARVLTAALGMAMLVSGSVAAQRWQSFTSGTGKFTVQMPGAPKFQKRTVKSAAGPLALSSYSVATDRGRTAYTVTFVEYPAAVVAGSTPDKLLELARDGQLANLKATASSDRAIRLNGYPGRDVTFAGANEFSGRSRIFLVKSRLYQVVALTRGNASPASDLARFVASFKLTP